VKKMHQENAKDPSPTAERIRHELSHADIEIDDSFRLTILRLEASEGEEQHWIFDFNEAFLPPNSTYPFAKRFVDSEWHVRTVALCAQEYLRRCRNSKSRTTRAKKIIRDITMTLEYLWLNDVQKLENAHPYHFANLAFALSQGGWVHALKLKERISALGQQVIASLISKELGKSGFLEYVFSGNEIRQLVGTNSVALRRLLVEISSGKVSEEGVKWGASTLMETLNSVNLLYDIGVSMGLNKPPYVNAYKLATKLGAPSSRTKNIDAEAAAILLKNAVSWIYEYGPTIASLMEEVSKEVVDLRALTRKYMGRRLKLFFQDLPSRISAQRNLPFPVRHLDFGRRTEERSQSLRTAILCLITACYVIIASMNGRRKDEISHKKFGLRVGDLTVLNEELELYQIDFYIEKTYRKRLPFYVNKITADAVRLLERLESSYKHIDDALGIHVGSSRSLFSYRRFSQMRGVGGKKKWYSFAASSGANEEDALPFLIHAFGDKPLPAVSSHMFRRMYALIFYYQYENSDLQALMHQLGHFDLTSTMIYVTDPKSRSELERISSVMDVSSSEIQRARLSHIEELQEQINEVGDEKFAEDILSILDGARRAGGYERFVRRVHVKLSHVASIDLQDTGSLSIVGVLKQRGHFPKPMRHGQCMAGSTLSVKSAHCVSKNKKELDRSIASASTCGNCIFHLTSPAYISNIESDLKEMQRELDLLNAGTLAFEQKRQDHRNITHALHLLRERLHE
jgi:hypothetical protein